MTAPLRVVTQNVKSFPAMSAEAVAHDINLTASQADVVIWQEITTKPTLRARYRDTLLALDGWAHAGLDTNTPVSWRTDKVRRIAAGTVALHKGVAKVMPGKRITWVLLEDLATGYRFVASSVHYVAGAWNAKKKTFKGLRKRIWNEMRAAHLAWLTEQIKHGDPILTAGDFNRTNPDDGATLLGDLVGGRRIRYPLLGRAGHSIDHFALIDGTGTVFVDATYDYLAGRRSDHQGRRLTITLAARTGATPTTPTTPPQPEEPPVTNTATVPAKKGEAAKVIAWAKKQIGYHEGRTGSTWNNIQKYAAMAGHANGYAWCATFVCAAFKQTGLSGLLATPSAGCDQLAVGFKTAGRWSEYPAVGAVAFYGKASDLSHTGIVERFDDTYIWTIEGNTNTNGSSQGDGVYGLKRRRHDAYVVGYGYPAYAEGIVSADPAWKNPTPSQPTPPPTQPPAPSSPADTNVRTLLEAALADLAKTRADITKALAALPKESLR